jgi:transcriptional regulator with XRE-family HTH domain
VVSELAEFLRARREGITPAEVGLADSGRRRTPGLRREEVATLAGVSIDYLVRLEQGRDLNPSPAVLGALAGALRLTDVEKHHMAVLAAKALNPGLCPSVHAADREVPATVRVLLDRLEPTPSFVVGPYGDVLAWNVSWQTLAAPLGVLDAVGATDASAADGGPNLARYVFESPQSREVYLDWNAAADEQVSHLRSASLRWNLDERLITLLDELASVPEFAGRWSAHEVAEKRRGEERLVHPDAGQLAIAYEVLSLGDDGDQRLVTWLPADARTEAAFDDLGATATPSSPARLRVVGDN